MESGADGTPASTAVDSWFLNLQAVLRLHHSYQVLPLSAGDVVPPSTESSLPHPFVEPYPRRILHTAGISILGGVFELLGIEVVATFGAWVHPIEITELKRIALKYGWNEDFALGR